MTGITAERDVIHLALEDRCSHCGAQLMDDQEWCHQCGAARTLIHRPPDWRIGIAIVATVAALAVVIFVLVLSNLSSSSGSPSQARAAATATTVAAPKQSGTGALTGWPVGLGGWTVSLATGRTRVAAAAKAHRIATAGVQVGVLDSTLHPALKPGRWIVFSSRYPTKARAQAAAAQLVSLGYAHAHALLVGRPA
jgi:hypothetical protein